jgi:hypothetical protein
VSGFEALGEGLGDGARAIVGPDGRVVLAFILATVFVWSGATKVARPARAATALRDFGATASIRPRAGLALGGFELVLASGLAFAAGFGSLTSVFAPLAALTLLAFTAGQVRSLRRGERFSCFCFGDETVELSWSSAARTGALAGLAAALAASDLAAATGPAQVTPEHASVALALVGMAALTGLWPRLKRWSHDPFGLRPELWVRRG